MKAIGVVIIFLLMGIVGIQGFELMEKRKVVVYEYDIEFYDGPLFESMLNLKGSDGWELVNARRAMDTDESWGYECILRRKKLVKK